MIQIENIHETIEFPLDEPGVPPAHPSQRNPNCTLPPGVWNLVVAGEFRGATCRLERKIVAGSVFYWQRVGEFKDNFAVELDQPGASYRYRLVVEPGPKAPPDLLLAIDPAA